MRCVRLAQGGDFLHVLLAMLVTSVFFLWFVISAIVHENAYELLITTVLSAMIAVRVVYFVVSYNSLIDANAGLAWSKLHWPQCDKTLQQHEVWKVWLC